MFSTKSIVISSGASSRSIFKNGFKSFPCDISLTVLHNAFLTSSNEVLEKPNPAAIECPPKLSNNSAFEEITS